MAVFLAGAVAIDEWTKSPRPDQTPASAPDPVPAVVSPVAPLTAAKAGRTMAALRRAMRPRERVILVTIADGSSSAYVGTAGGSRSRFLTKLLDKDVESSDSGPVPELTTGTPVADLDAEAPGRLTASVVRELGPGSTGSVSEVSTFTNDDDELAWSATVQGVGTADEEWRGDRHGRSVVRVADGATTP